MKFGRLVGRPRQALAALALVLIAASFGAQVALGQTSSEMTALYGRGIHSYFAGQSQQALDQFSQVIDAGSVDPRVYYFRAMARLRLGQRYEAQHDMQLGASHEAKDPGGAGDIGQALSRIQGADRQLLERYRRQARIERAQQSRTLSQNRYEQRRSREAEVLRNQPEVNLGDLAPTSPGAAPATSGQAAPPTPQPQLPGEPAAAASDPFAQPGAAADPATPPAGVAEQPTPFGEPDAGELTPPQDPPQDGAPEAAGSDPFGSTDEPEPAAEPDPSEEPTLTPPAAGADPFGETGSDAVAPPADSTPDSSVPAGEFGEIAEDSPTADADETGVTGAISGDDAGAPSGNMAGILGRVFARTVPLPSLDALKRMAPPIGPGGPMPGGPMAPGPEGPPDGGEFEVGPTDAPPGEAAPEGGDPFAQPPAGAPDEGSPFGAPPAGESSTAPPALPPQDGAAADAGDPFGSSSSEPASDPFGQPSSDAPEEAPPAEAEPAAEEPAAGEDAAEPAADEEDPFAF